MRYESRSNNFWPYFFLKSFVDFPSRNGFYIFFGEFFKRIAVGSSFPLARQKFFEHFLGKFHEPFPVLISQIKLQHREFRIMIPVNSFVTKNLAKFKYFFKPTYQKAFQK